MPRSGELNSSHIQMSNIQNKNINVKKKALRDSMDSNRMHVQQPEEICEQKYCMIPGKRTQPKRLKQISKEKSLFSPKVEMILIGQNRKQNNSRGSHLR